MVLLRNIVKKNLALKGALGKKYCSKLAKAC